MNAHDLLWIGFDGKDAAEVPETPVPGAVILFARNLDPDPVAGPARCHALIQGLMARWGGGATLPVAVDQEGGAVSRLKAWVGPTPGLRDLWQAGGAGACAAWGDRWSRGLRLLGFNVDFAPVADLWDGHPDTGMGGRCASEDPHETVRAAGAFLHGLESGGVRGCLKHYPGLGGTTVDSHKALPELRDMAQIARNLQPFRALAHRDRLVMVAHLKTPGTCGQPASLHRGTVAGNPWGLAGRWIPDDLEMGGCADIPWLQRVRLALEAGHEALLVCQSRAGVEACAAAAADLPEALWRPAAERFAAFREGLPPAGTGPFQEAAWSAWVAEVKAEAAPFL